MMRLVLLAAALACVSAQSMQSLRQGLIDAMDDEVDCVYAGLRMQGGDKVEISRCVQCVCFEGGVFNCYDVCRNIQLSGEIVPLTQVPQGGRFFTQGDVRAARANIDVRVRVEPGMEAEALDADWEQLGDEAQFDQRLINQRDSRNLDISLSGMRAAIGGRESQRAIDERLLFEQRRRAQLALEDEEGAELEGDDAAFEEDEELGMRVNLESQLGQQAGGASFCVGVVPCGSHAARQLEQILLLQRRGQLARGRAGALEEDFDQELEWDANAAGMAELAAEDVGYYDDVDYDVASAMGMGMGMGMGMSEAEAAELEEAEAMGMGMASIDVNINQNGAAAMGMGMAGM